MRGIVGRLFNIAVIVALLHSCIPLSETVYLQTERKQENQSYTLKREEYVVGYNDILYILVKTVDSEVLTNPGINGSYANESLFYLTGYTVDDKGYVDLPMIGQVYVFGKDIPTITTDLGERIKIYFKNAVVTVKPSGIQATILGEVHKPGKYTFYENNVTIFDIISKGGDITAYGNRRKMKVVRRTDDEVKVYYVDLTSQDIFTSDFYFIQPGDVVYIQPLPMKSWGIGVNGAGTLQIVFSMLTSTLLLINYLNN